MSNATGTISIRERPQHLAKEEAHPFRRLGLLIAIHSETALAQTTLVPSSYVAEENYLYCNPASNGDKRHGDFRPDLDPEPDIYPVLGLPLAPPASMLFGFLAVASCDKTSRAMAVLRTLAASWWLRKPRDDEYVIESDREEMFAMFVANLKSMAEALAARPTQIEKLADVDLSIADT